MDKVVLIILHTYMYVYIHKCLLYYNYKKSYKFENGKGSLEEGIWKGLEGGKGWEKEM